MGSSARLSRAVRVRRYHPRPAASAKRRAPLPSDMAAPMVSPLLMLLLAGASAFAPPRAAHAPLRASAAPKLSSIVMEDRVFALKIPLGDVRSWLGLGLASSSLSTCAAPCTCRARATCIHTHTTPCVWHGMGACVPRHAADVDVPVLLVRCGGCGAAELHSPRLHSPRSTHLACRRARPTSASRRASRRASR